MPLVSKFRRHSTWYLRYARSVGLPRRSLKTSDKVLAEAIRVQEEHRVQFARYGIKGTVLKRIAWSGFAQLYLHYVRDVKGRKPNTLTAYHHALNNFGSSLQRDEFLQKIDTATVERFITLRRKEERAPKTIRNELIILKGAFKWAVRQGYCHANPLAEVELPKRVKSPPRYIRTEDYHRLMSIASPEWRDVFKFYLLTGIRRRDGVLLDARRHVDLRLGVVWLPQEKQQDYKAFPISPELMPILKRLVKRADADGRFIPHSEDWLTRRFRRYRDKLGLPKYLTFHSLRHTFATWLAAEGVGFATLQAAGGWQDVQSVQKYVKPFEEHLELAVNRLKLPRARRQKSKP